MPQGPWHLHHLEDGTQVLRPESGHDEARVLLTSCADFLGTPIEVAVTTRGLFVKTSFGWGCVEAWEAESVPEAIEYALR